ELVVAAENTERGEKVEYCSRWWRHTRPAAFEHCLNSRLDVAAQIAHPAADTIARHPVDAIAPRPLIKQEWKINPCPDRDFDRGGQPWVDFHQERTAIPIATKLHFGIALQLDLAHQTLCLVPDVDGHGNALAKNRRAS